jgi:hypothetical protein
MVWVLGRDAELGDTTRVVKVLRRALPERRAVVDEEPAILSVGRMKGQTQEAAFIIRLPQFD